MRNACTNAVLPGGRLIAAVVTTAVATLLALTGMAGDARAQVVSTEVLPGGVERTVYRLGPVEVTPGQNRIKFRPITGASRPAVDGWITRIKPDLVNLDGSIPKSSKVMFHHGVWMNISNSTELFYATGEEKTILELPDGYGYQYKTSDIWTLNDMIHNLTPERMDLYFQYTLDFIPETAAEADDIIRARPIWMDVESGIYPVFDVWRDSGGADGEFTYPEDAENPYGNGPPKNVKTIGQNGVLLGTTGHVHTGGLSTNLYLRRNGASYAGPICPERKSFDDQLIPLREKRANQNKRIRKIKQRNAKLNRNLKKIRRTMKKRTKKAKAKAKRQISSIKRRKKANQKLIRKINVQKKKTAERLASVVAKDKAEGKRDAACRATQPQVDDGNRVHLFDSEAKYFDPRGPISWDMSMYSTDEDWRVRVKAGDKLELQTTYETEIASWPESMGINIVYWARDNEIPDRPDVPDPDTMPNPYVTKVDTRGVLNHGHLEENEDYGGKGGPQNIVGPDPRTLPDGEFSGGPFTIADYMYPGADFRLPGSMGYPPVVKKGQSFTFKLSDYDIKNEVWHSLTSCKAPCNKSTGISYPIPDGDFQFESGQMGPGQAPTVGYTQWSTPKDLPRGTHTFFCRIHPLMRGAIRVK